MGSLYCLIRREYIKCMGYNDIEIGPQKGKQKNSKGGPTSLVVVVVVAVAVVVAPIQGSQSPVTHIHR